MEQQAIDASQGNRHAPTVDGFGDEWTRFDQSALSPIERAKIFEMYFGIFPWSILPEGACGFDAGCGSGRWASCVAPRVGELHCIDASGQALDVARKNLADLQNCRFHHASVDDMPLERASMDFGYSLGVLHHVPDTAAGIRACVDKLKPGAPFLIYLYYALENRPMWYRLLWRGTNVARQVISRSPYGLRYVMSQVIATTVYFPLARTASLAQRIGVDPSLIPLSFYRDRSFYTMRTDALDRFGTLLEKRFRRDEIAALLHSAGLERIAFSPSPPFWCAVGYRKS